MHLIPPQPNTRKWNIRLRLPDGRIVKIAGDEDRGVAQRIGDRIEMLIKAKLNGDPPPGELGPWIDNMPLKLAERLIELGLLPRRRFERNKPLTEHVKTYELAVAARKTNKAKHAKHQAGRVLLVIEALAAKTFDDLTATSLTDYLHGRKMAVSTKRGYIIVMKDFAKEMVRRGVAQANPFADIEAPGQYENPEYERQPLTIEQFQKLMTHLDTFTRYFMQKARWTANDRKLLYWTAVKTGYRQSELRALRRANLFLDESPAIISLKARHTKNNKEGEVPIPADLARALKVYVADKEPNDCVFTMPSTSGSIVDMMRRDLAGAGIVWQLTTGEVIDFHTLRCTAITWWLDVDGLKPRRVQTLARLATLALVYRYSRNLRLEDYSWLDQGPTLVTSSHLDKKEGNDERQAI